MNKKKSIAVIPARGGSKRIPRKNVRLFNDKPIISYSITQAIESGLFERVIVSTDDEEIAEISSQYGAEVPFIRPDYLSDDFSVTQDVIDHAIQILELNNDIYDYCCTIYATAPFVRKKYLKLGLEKISNSDAIFAFGVTSMPFPIQRTFKITENNRIKMFWPENFSIRSQDLTEAYQDAGQFCWQDIKKYRQSKKIENIFSEISIPIQIPRHMVQDIDTLEDWKRAEFMYNQLHYKP